MQNMRKFMRMMLRKINKICVDPPAPTRRRGERFDLPASPRLRLQRVEAGRKSAAKGFTVIELLVSMSVFIILMGIIANIFIGSLKTQRALVALMTANDNAGLAIEQMARELRTGSGFCIVDKTTGSCSSQAFTSGDAIGFTNADGINVVYQFNNFAIERSSGSGFIQLTSANVIINRLVFVLVHDYFRSQGSTNLWPPRITISLEVGSASKQLTGFFTNMQTTVSARNL